MYYYTQHILYMNSEYFLDKNLLLTTLFIFIHGLIIIPTGYIILFNNNITLVSLLTFILLLVYIQVHFFGCILNKFENNASIKFLSHLIGLPSVKEEELTSGLVFFTFLICLIKLFVLYFLPQITHIKFYI